VFNFCAIIVVTNTSMAEETEDPEVKIRAAARRVFFEQGYEGAKIRQIAEAAGVNLAMVNYYFRSKEELFKSIYLESFQELIGRIGILLNEETPLEVKIWKIVDQYTDFILANPLVPVFVLSELRNNGANFFKELNVKGVIENSVFHKQLLQETQKGHIRAVEPLQVVFTLMSNIIFPVMAKPILSYVGTLDENGFQQFVLARKQLIPEMIMAYLKPV
jgi:TetR/AcrR family transcriptional regulator